jgi:hypothetical protein
MSARTHSFSLSLTRGHRYFVLLKSGLICNAVTNEAWKSAKHATEEPLYQTNGSANYMRFRAFNSTSQTHVWFANYTVDSRFCLAILSLESASEVAINYVVLARYSASIILPRKTLSRQLHGLARCSCDHLQVYRYA